MEDKKLIRLSLITSQIIVILFLIVNIHVFINTDSTIAKLYATASFVGFLFLLIFSLKATFKLNAHSKTIHK